MFTADWGASLRTNLERIYPSKPETKKICAEVGSFEGMGSLHIVRYLCNHEDSKLYCIDPWLDSYGSIADVLNTDWLTKTFTGQYARFLRNTAGNQKIVPMRGPSNTKIPDIPDTLDFAYIDGDHAPQQVYKDAVNILSKMKQGGIILFDDYEWVNNGVHTKLGIDRFLYEYSSKIDVILRNYQLAVRVR